MADQFGNLSPEDFAQQQAITRQQRLATMLMQNTAQPQGQMISGRYVAPSFFQNITPLVNAYFGKQMQEEGDTQQMKLAEAIRGRNSADMQKFFDLQKGTANYKPAVMPPLLRDDQGSLMPPVEQQVGQAPNPQAAAMFASNSYNPMLRQIGGSLISNMIKEPELTNVPAGGSLVRTKDGKTETVFTAPEKLSPTEMQRNYGLARQQGFQGSFMDYQKELKNMVEPRLRISVGGTKDGINETNEPLVNNNGVKKARYDKIGRLITADGSVYSPTKASEAMDAHDAAVDLAYTLNQLTGQDIKNAYNSTFDYTTNKPGRLIGKLIPETVDAQTKINSLQIGKLLDNLSKLKGASSDKEMGAMLREFPSYEAQPDVMEKWVERATAVVNRFLKRSENRYGFDTEYAKEGRFTGNNTKPVTPQSNEPKVGEVRQGYKFKGGDQYDKNNWAKVQ